MPPKHINCQFQEGLISCPVVEYLESNIEHTKLAKVLYQNVEHTVYKVYGMTWFPKNMIENVFNEFEQPNSQYLPLLASRLRDRNSMLSNIKVTLDNLINLF